MGEWVILAWMQRVQRQIEAKWGDGTERQLGDSGQQAKNRKGGGEISKKKKKKKKKKKILENAM